MRINGIGTTFLGISKPDENGISTVTHWFTFFFLPIFPFSRKRVRFLPHQGTGFSYEFISSEKLNWFEIVKTYLFGWIIIPLVGLLPLILAIKEVWQAIGLPSVLHIPYIILTIIWIIVLIWKLLDWQESKCRPQEK